MFEDIREINVKFEDKMTLSHLENARIGWKIRNIYSEKYSPVFEICEYYEESEDEDMGCKNCPLHEEGFDCCSEINEFNKALDEYGKTDKSEKSWEDVIEVGEKFLAVINLGIAKIRTRNWKELSDYDREDKYNAERLTFDLYNIINDWVGLQLAADENSSNIMYALQETNVICVEELSNYIFEHEM
jgi:hypothetical protein